METGTKTIRKKRAGKVLASLSLVAILALAIFIYVRFYFVWGEGVKTGELNYVVYKGYVFKTYEGKLIQTGLSSSANGIVQSNEFVFSIEDEAIYLELERANGHIVDLRYKEYLGALPWRGNTRYIVYDVVDIKPKQDSPIIP